MRAERLALALAAALCACKPTAAGRCFAPAVCPSGSTCSVDKICIAESGHCTPDCGVGELCSGGLCQLLPPAVSVKAPEGAIISPSHATVLVSITAAPSLVLGALHVEVDGTVALASADVAAAQPGDGGVVLGHFVDGVEGQATVAAQLNYRLPDGGTDRVVSLTEPVSYDDAPPVVSSIFFPTGQGQVGDWFAASGPDIQVRAEVADGAQGSGPLGATLSFDPPCPAHAQCSYQGNLVTPGSTSIFSFALPRAAQVAGSEALLPFHVIATDRAGNASTPAAGVLRIDAKAPQFGAVTIITPGVVGEDGRTWYAGSAPIDLAIAISDNGVGLDPAALTLSLVPADVDNDPGPIAGTIPVPPDGTVRFRVPVNASLADGGTDTVTTREAPVHFTVAARDRFGQPAALPASNATAINLDAQSPTVTLAHFDLAGAAPDWTSVCGQADVVDVFSCGRGPQNAPVRALRDDTLTATFDVIDCGAGLAGAGGPAPANWSVTSGGVTKMEAVAAFAPQPGACSNGSTNPVHRYSLTLTLAADVPALDPPDANGVTRLFVETSGTDLLGQMGSVLGVSDAPPGGDGILDVSRVRWKRQLHGEATGAPLLTAPAAGGRSVVVGLATASGNVSATKPTGAADWSATLAQQPAGELALGASGAVYAVTGVRRACGGQQCGTLFALTAAPPSATQATLDIANATFGAPLSVVPLGSGSEAAIAVPTVRDALSFNVYAWVLASGTRNQSAARVTSSQSSIDQGTFNGVTQAGGSVYLAHSKGFSSTGFSAGGVFTTTATDDSDTKFAAAFPPALRGETDVHKQSPALAFSDQKVRLDAWQDHCGGVSAQGPCWGTTWTDSNVLAAAALGTPVFDQHQVVVTDASGAVTALDLASGARLWQTVAPAPAVTPPRLSGPVLVRPASGNSPSPVLVLGSDGKLRRLQPPSSPGAPDELALVIAAPFGGAFSPPSPVLDARGAGSVAYFVDGAGWLLALQLDDPPLDAQRAVWPRPSRDSCNSRSADSTCK